MIDWVVLDVGETLIDETRVWATWAHELGVTQLTFAAALGAVIERADGQSVFDILGLADWRNHRLAVEAAYGGFRAEDLYPEALSVVDRIRMQGRRVAIVANQPAARHDQLLALGVRPDVLAMSETMGVSKPDAAFFARTLELLGDPSPSTVAYVGDRVDNDVTPAHRAGMRAIWIRRGPWGRLQHDARGDADLVIETLDELVTRLPDLDG